MWDLGGISLPLAAFSFFIPLSVNPSIFLVLRKWGSALVSSINKNEKDSEQRRLTTKPTFRRYAGEPHLLPFFRGKPKNRVSHHLLPLFHRRSFAPAICTNRSDLIRIPVVIGPSFSAINLLGPEQAIKQSQDTKTWPKTQGPKKDLDLRNSLRPIGILNLPHFTHSDITGGNTHQ